MLEQHSQLFTNELPAKAGESLSLLIFAAEGRTLALRIADVTEITPIAALSCEPGSPSILAGFLNLRGVLMPVLRMTRLLDIPDQAAAFEQPTCIVFLQSGDARMGLLATRVHQVIDVERHAIVELASRGITPTAVQFDASIVPLISVDDLVLKQEHDRICELRLVLERRIQDLGSAAA
ncbi:MAG: chemotaxis protein CheW [Phycisphaerales bacterium]